MVRTSVQAGGDELPRRTRTLALGLFLLSALLHAPAFWAPHREGDEVVNYVLAREMGWDASNYTTRDHPLVRSYPFSIYRQPLFHHPPLYAYLVKIADRFGSAEILMLTLQVLAMALALAVCRRWLLDHGARLWTHVYAYAQLALCPLLLFSTSRLHHDGLLGIVLCCALLEHARALEGRSLGRAALASGLFAIALNLRFTALACVPWPLLVHALWRWQSGPETETSAPWQRRPLVLTALVLVGVVLVGFPHYVRLLVTYHTLLPTSFIVPDADASTWNLFLARTLQRTRLDMAAYLLASFPVLALVILPGAGPERWPALLRRPIELLPLWGALYLVASTLAFSHNQLRYFAVASPLLALGQALLCQRAASTHPRLAATAALVSLVVAAGGVSMLLRDPELAEVVPWVFTWPPLSALYR